MRQLKVVITLDKEGKIMGSTIGCHVGAGAVAFAFIAKEQRPY